MNPELLYLIVSDDVRVDPQNYQRIDILGLMRNLRSTAAPPFPVVRPLFCVIVVLRAADAAGQSGDLIVRIVQDAPGLVIFRTQARRTRFVNDPEQTSGAVFRIHNCSFPDAGLYWVECLFSGTVLGRQRLSLRA